MRLHRLIFGIAPILMLGCDGPTPAEPELPAGPEPIVSEGYYGGYDCGYGCGYDCGYGCGCDCCKPPEENLEGRMTGGGVVRLGGEGPEGPVEVKITHGFTLHCDQRLSNNLEVNWGGNQWHINPKGVLSDVSCTDDPLVAEEPPPAPFDKLCAKARGRYNGELGYKIDFCLQDAGEPGGKNDKASMTITGPLGGLVLEVPWGLTESGNLQAHYDQPHKSH